MQAEEIARIQGAAASRVTAARSLTAPSQDATAAVLLRDAVSLRLRAIAEAHVSEPPISAEMRALLDSTDPLLFDRMARSEVVEARKSLARLAAELAPLVEARSVDVIRATRIARQLALVLAVLLVVYHFARPHIGAPNVALGKPVTASGQTWESAPLADLVDGNDDDRKPVVSARGEGAWLAVDLGGLYNVSSIRMVNRQDHNYDDALPFHVEVSTDGEHWKQIARRRDHFRDWTLKVEGSDVEWVGHVRVHCISFGQVGLNELEVHARPAH